MTNSMSCSHGRWCTRADALLGVEGVHLSSVTATAAGLVLGVETGEDLTGCPDCGVVAVGHGRRPVRLHDIPCFGRPVRLMWAKRVWRCPDPDCPRTTFSEEHPLAGPHAKLTARAVGWATDALQLDTSVSALAHQLGVSWWMVRAALTEACPLTLPEVDELRPRMLGIDEHRFRSVRFFRHPTPPI
ncbi:transposase family protein [Arthrobacter sp. 2YAF22_2]|uniref:transposase family protein n=1 Tax=Arthrobacter sp. 2YAF22_2 TaxID=3233029 RepID=UPI003F8F15B5